MDSNLLLNNPKEFIDGIAQLTDEMPDLGLKNKIDGFLEENPDFINQIPIVATLGHLQMSIPGSLIRLRCVLIQNIRTEFLPLRLLVDDKYYTPIFQQDIPEGGEMPDFRTFASRKNILVSSIPYLSQWLVNELRPDVEDSPQHHNIQGFSPSNPIPLFEEPFQLNAKFLYDHPDTPCLMCDLIGFVDDPEPFSPNPHYDSGEDAYFSSIPSFIALTSVPVQSLYSPQISSPEPSLDEIRQHLMAFLTEIFEPLQAELLLLWMVGSVKSRKDLVLIGLFSLNLFEVEPQVAQLIISLFRFFFTSVVDINLNVESLNSRTLRPCVEHSELKSTPLIAACETRLIINETELDEGDFEIVGTENLRILQKIIGQQIVDYSFEGDIYPIFVSYPTLILSRTRSILFDPVSPIQAYLPIGNVNQTELNVDQNLLILMRKYIENIRYCDFDFTDDDSDITANLLKDLIGNNRQLTQNDLHFLMILNKLNCISHGSDSITKEIWDRSYEIFTSTLPYQKT